MQSHWYDPLRAIRSLGSQKKKIENMGQLAEQRKEHLGQFFTPDDVAQFMWSFVANLEVRDIFDNSIGSGRLVQYADPLKHQIWGVDVHQEAVDQVKKVVEAAGFEAEILCAGMEEIHPRGMDVSLINPPFSIHLESPFLEHFHNFTRIGKFGPHTSATSDEYAVIQALRCSSIVVALLPKSSADAIRKGEGCWSSSEIPQRLRAVFDLPPGTFKGENANVLTSVVVFGELKGTRNFHHIVMESIECEIPYLGLEKALETNYGRKSKTKLGYQHLDTSGPTITLPVTGDNTVIVSLDGRKIKLKYACGLAQARVANAILGKRIHSTEHVRLPKGVHYSGQGKLDLEVYLLQDDPLASFDAFVESIKANGGKPVVRPGVRETVIKKIKRHKRAAMPLKHTIWSRGATGAKQLSGKARKTHNVDSKKWLSPVIKQDEEVSFMRQDSGKFAYEKNGKSYEITADELESRYFLQGAFEGWQVVHAGLLEAYPQEAARLRKRMATLGIDKWLSWDFQQDDCIEMSMVPKGAVLGWEQACGKSRGALAMLLFSECKHGLIVVESRLIDEMVGQLKKVDFDMSMVNVIDSPEKLSTLKKVNIIAYERLRLLVDESKSKRITYAHKLRRRIGILLADEGERLANITSDQCKALFQVSARKTYVLTGTPIANYPRDIHGVMVFVAGDGTAAQPYGYRKGYIEKNWINSMEFAGRGIDAVISDYVVLEWVTYEWMESMKDGAKREIPKIANVEKFRSWIAPHTKRRLTAEPEVAKFIKLPELKKQVIDVQWDAHHLAFYLQACDDFAQWYKNREGDKKNNLAVLLAKLQAVQIALNAPQKGVDGIGVYTGLTSKQRIVLDYLVGIADNGKKALLYCENPDTVDLLHDALKENEIDSVRFHGGVSIKKRVKDKDAKFVNGTTPHLLATKGSAKAGYNLPMADYVLFYDRSWSAKTESQCMRRPLRTERKDPVNVVYFHLPGSLDLYMDQMVAFKADSANAGLDYATPELDDTEFLHLSNILESFVNDLAKFRNMSSHNMRELLKKAQAGSFAEVA